LHYPLCFSISTFDFDHSNAQNCHVSSYNYTFMQALGLLCETVRDIDTVKSNRKNRKGFSSHLRSNWLHMDETALGLFEKMSLEIISLVDESIDDSSTSLKLAAVSALEVLASRFPSKYSIFCNSLASVTEGITLHNFAFSSSCLRTTGSLINVLEPRSVAELPRIMDNVIKIYGRVSSCSDLKTEHGDEKPPTAVLTFKESLFISILVTLEAVVNMLGGILNPYLGDIIEILVLHPKYVLGTDLKLTSKADEVQKLLTEKIPVSLSVRNLIAIFVLKPIMLR
jgi:U3 small nucleolar RNA-associated protein 10